MKKICDGYTPENPTFKHLLGLQKKRCDLIPKNCQLLTPHNFQWTQEFLGSKKNIGATQACAK